MHPQLWIFNAVRPLHCGTACKRADKKSSNSFSRLAMKFKFDFEKEKWKFFSKKWTGFFYKPANFFSFVCWENFLSSGAKRNPILRNCLYAVKSNISLTHFEHDTGTFFSTSVTFFQIYLLPAQLWIVYETRNERINLFASFHKFQTTVVAQ